MGSITKKNAADDVSTDSARNWMDSQYSGSDTNTSGDILHSATEVKINTIKVFDTGAADPKAIFTINTTTGAVTTVLGSAGISVDADQDNNGTYDDVVVFGFSTLDTIEWTTDAAHDAVLIEGYSGAWDVGGFNIEQGIDTPDIDLSFSVAVTDKDGDTYRGLDSTWDDFTIKLDGTGTFNDLNNVPPLPSASWVPSYDLI
jgi:hypothetical protein